MLCDQTTFFQLKHSPLLGWRGGGQKGRYPKIVAAVMSGGSFAKAKQGCDDALGVMRDNISMLQERDVKLHDLQDKSLSFQGAATQFQRRTVALSWKTKWQKYRLIGFLVTLIVWGLLMIPFRQHLAPYVAVSTGLLGALYLVYRCFERRLRMAPEAQQPLTEEAYGIAAEP